MTLILPRGVPDHMMILDKDGNRLRSFERKKITGATLCRLDEDGEPTGDCVHVPHAEIAIFQ